MRLPPFRAASGTTHVPNLGLRYLGKGSDMRRIESSLIADRCLLSAVILISRRFLSRITFVQLDTYKMADGVPVHIIPEPRWRASCERWTPVEASRC